MIKDENIYTLINRVMSEVGGVEKNSKNAQQGYSFRGIDDLYAALQPPLVKYGVFYVTDVEKIERTERESKSGGMLTCTVLTVSFTFYAPDGSSILVRTVGEGMDSGDKSCSKGMSTALKYALLQLFCIPTSEPKDSEHESPEPVYKRNVDRQTGEVTLPKIAEGKMTKFSVMNSKFDEPDWTDLITVGKTKLWPEGYIKQWIKEQKETGEAADNIYSRGMAKFSLMNSKAEVGV
jgi:hypothetical protein